MSIKLHGFPLSSEFEVNCFGHSFRAVYLIWKKAEAELRKSTCWQSYNFLPGQLARQHSALIFKNRSITN